MSGAALLLIGLGGLAALGLLAQIVDALPDVIRARADARLLKRAAGQYSREDLELVAYATAIRAGGTMATSAILEDIARLVVEDLDEGLLDGDTLGALRSAGARARLKALEDRHG